MFTANSMMRQFVIGAYNYIESRFLALVCTILSIIVASYYFYVDENDNLIRAAAIGDKQKVVKALENEADINFKGRMGLTPLVLASHEGHIEIVRLLLANNAVVNLQDDNRGSALMAASASGGLEIVNELLSAGADKDAKRKVDFSTALYFAASGGHVEIVKRLLSEGCDVGWKNSRGFTALSAAVESACKFNPTEFAKTVTIESFLEILRLLNAAGADTETTSLNGWTPLLTASRNGCVPMVKELLSIKANALFSVGVGKRGITPILAACMGPYPVIVDMLLKAGASANATEAGAKPPLLTACTPAPKKRKGLNGSGAAAVVPSVVKGDGDEDGLGDGKGEGDGVRISPEAETVRLLLEGGADPNYTFGGVATPLLMVSWSGNIAIIKMLLEKGANVSLTRSDGWDALIAAADGGSFDAAKLLLQAKADPNSASKPLGWTALHAAAARGDLDMCHLLLESGAEIRPTSDFIKEGSDGLAVQSPTHVAAFEGHARVLELLLKRGAEVNALDSKGNTPLHAACFGAAMDMNITNIQGRDVTDANGDPGVDSVLVELQAIPERGTVASLEVLLRNGADVGLLNSDGFNAAGIAGEVGKAGGKAALRFLLSSTEIQPIGTRRLFGRILIARMKLALKLNF